jgi:rfaE bifunctional protein kinase chain/domain/rfaE bifunctional protein nucleotidyltransferase chain/domain
MSASPLVVVGDCLLDRDLEGRVERLSPDAPVPVVEDLRERPRPGGAGLAASLAAGDGRQVCLVTALARDAAGEQLRALLEEAGVQVIDLGLEGATPEKVRVRSAGQTLLRLDQGGKRTATVGPPPPRLERALEAAAAVLVSDYGWGLTAHAALRSALAAAGRPLIWDPHPLGARPLAGALLVTPNRREAGAGRELGDVVRKARALRRSWQAQAVVVTLGPEGALLVTGDGAPLVAPAPRLSILDPCGAGDRFASTAAGLLADGASVEEAVTAAVSSASAFVAAGGASAAAFLRPAPAEVGGELGMEAAIEVAQRTRAVGGRVVATGGCFDLLHAGHVSVVLINSDQSVRRLKGPDRPLVEEADRAAVIAALECVDAVAIFEEATPEAALRRLRPDVFAKGGDYAGAQLPEAAVLAEWGAEVVVLPYLKGRSTSRLVKEVMRGGTG